MEDEMNEWKELEVDNLPPDILTGDYEFGIINKTNENYLLTDIIKSEHQDNITIVMRVYKKIQTYYYRKPEPKQLPIAIAGEELKGGYIIYLKEGKAFKIKPKQPSHEERAEKYIKNLNVLYMLHNDIIELIKKAFINGRESADIPPEAE